MKGGAHVAVKTYYVCGFPITDDITHSGIEGQKWGVRRFQNYDGTLTPAGKERYYGNRKSTPSKAAQSIKNVAKKYKEHVVNTIKKNHPWLMDDEELTRVLTRMTMEQKVRNIRKDEKASRLVNKIAKESKKVLIDDIVVSGVKDFGRNFLQTSGKEIAKSLFGDGNDGKKDKKEDADKKETGGGTHVVDEDVRSSGHGHTVSTKVAINSRRGWTDLIGKDSDDDKDKKRKK